MDTFQSIKRSISPQIFLVHYPLAGLTDTLHFENGVMLSGVWFNVFSKDRERFDQFTLQGDVTLHLAAAKSFPGWCYIQVWDKESKGYGCTCRERKSAGYCAHIEALKPEVLASAI
jgi:hypothetical protein